MLRKRRYSVDSNRELDEMGVAARRRGDKAIRDTIYGPDLSVKKKPVKRGRDWGGKMYKMSLEYAEGLLKYYQNRGITVTIEDLADAILSEMKCGKQTALKVAEKVFKG